MPGTRPTIWSMPSVKRVPGMGMELSSSHPIRRNLARRRGSSVTTSGAEAAVARVRSMTGSYTAARRAETAG